MNTETRNYENERAVLATAIMCDNRQAKLEEKARKYDELKEGIAHLKRTVESMESKDEYSKGFADAMYFCINHMEGLI